mmetsp:Transcript_9988/g.12465  ORF Transcript_9988/g.12465 Transcript_9988/m.12465 type:complete len:219 (+) Transcript_9988:17-673(+)
MFIEDEDIYTVFSIFEACAKFAASFNDNMPLRVELLRRGFMTSKEINIQNKPPNLLRQETVSLGRYMQLLFIVKEEKNALGISLTLEKEVDARLKEVFSTLFRRYMRKDNEFRNVFEEYQTSRKPGESEADENSRLKLQLTELETELRQFLPLVVQSLQGMMKWEASTKVVNGEMSEMRKQLEWVYPLLTEMLECSSKELRTVLRRIFEIKIGPLLGL